MTQIRGLYRSWIARIEITDDADESRIAGMISHLPVGRRKSCGCADDVGCPSNQADFNAGVREREGWITRIYLLNSELLLIAYCFPDAIGRDKFCLLLLASCFLLFASHHSLLITHLNPPLQFKPQSFTCHGERKGGGNGFLQVFVDGMQLVIGMHGVVVGQQELLYTA